MADSSSESNLNFGALLQEVAKDKKKILVCGLGTSLVKFWERKCLLSPLSKKNLPKANLKS